jgi:hypothetical protein
MKVKYVKAINRMLDCRRDMGRNIVTLGPVEMMPVENAVKDFRHGVRWVDCAMNFEEGEYAATGLFLRRKILNVRVSCTPTGTAMRGHCNCAFVVFSGECRAREGET